MNFSKRILSLVAFACFFVLLLGCSTSPKISPPIQSPAQPQTLAQPKPQPQNRYSLSLADAQDKAIKLEIGISREQVLALLGHPDETAIKTYGSKTPNPWTGEVWTYRWSLENYTAKRLEIIFEQSKGSWIVNSWDWQDF
jgi:hypothetical protein